LRLNRSCFLPVALTLRKFKQSIPLFHFPVSYSVQCNAICQQCRKVAANLKKQKNFAKSKSSEGQHHQNVWLNLWTTHTRTHVRHSTCCMPHATYPEAKKELVLLVANRRPKKLRRLVVKMIMLKFYNLSRQSQTHSREITNTFVTRGCEFSLLPSSVAVAVALAATPDPLLGEVKNWGWRLEPKTEPLFSSVMKYTYPKFTCSNLKLSVLFVVSVIVVTVFVLFYAFTVLQGGISVKLAKTPLWVAQLWDTTTVACTAYPLA